MHFYIVCATSKLNKKNNPIQIQNELKLLRELVAKLNGQIEVVQYEVSNLADKQKTLYVDINNRLADLEAKLNNLPSNPQLNNVQENVSSANDLKDNLSNINKEPRADLGNLDSTQSAPAQETSSQSSAPQNASYAKQQMNTPNNDRAKHSEVSPIRRRGESEMSANSSENCSKKGSHDKGKNLKLVADRILN